MLAPAAAGPLTGPGAPLNDCSSALWAPPVRGKGASSRPLEGSDPFEFLLPACFSGYQALRKEGPHEPFAQFRFHSRRPQERSQALAEGHQVRRSSARQRLAVATGGNPTEPDCAMCSGRSHASTAFRVGLTCSRRSTNSPSRDAPTRSASTSCCVRRTGMATSWCRPHPQSLA